ncbi:ATP-grasp domain-containing protein [Saccharomonospora piscinae]|uniref:ATP-grasp domain-containing protein n=1 Tax=Saccharomonospora piscinae TaxID=687388 RepID=UPI0004672960|nr:ATP-grasp domain-containing protein [Saccharomonospora piscinae]
MTRRVLLLGGRAPHLRAARSLGLAVANVALPGEFPTTFQGLSDETLLSDFTDLDRVRPVVRAWHAAHPFAQVVSFTEEGLLPAALLREELGLGGTPAKTTARLRDKAAMRARLADSGLATVAHAEVSDAAGVRRFAAEHGYPVIVKPKDGVRSRGVHRVATDVEAEDAMRRLRADSSGEVLVEGLITGLELTAESVSVGGRHHVLGITEVFTDAAHLETGHVTPARIGVAEAEAIRSYVETFLDVMGVVEGPSHTQLFWTSDRGPVVIESHDRIGGDREHELLHHTYGHDVLALTFGLPTGLMPEPRPLVWSPREATAIWFLHGTGERLVGLGTVDDAWKSPGVVSVALAREDRLLDRVLTPSDRMGWVIARGADADEALARARRGIEALRLDYA